MDGKYIFSSYIVITSSMNPETPVGILLCILFSFEYIE